MRWFAPGSVGWMIEVELDAASVARVRVAASPVFEVAAWLCLTAQHGRHPSFGDPGPAARFALRDPQVAATATILASAEQRRYVPDFIVPKPAAGAEDHVLEEQLGKVRATPPARAHDQLAAACLTDDPRVQRLGVDDYAALVTSGLWRFWKQVLAEDWPQLRRSLQAHVRRAGDTAGQQGVAGLLNSVHPALSWRDGRLRVDKTIERRFAFVDREMVLVPSVLTWPRLSVQLDEPDDTYISFPCATATVRTLQPDASARLLGRGRSTVLAAVRLPATTREVAARVGLSESTVSHHLHALADAGLAYGIRRGRHVRYALSSAGLALLDSASAAG